MKPCTTAAFVLTLLFVGVLAMAPQARAQTYGDGSAELSATRQQQFSSYRRQSSEIQKKISALPDNAEDSIAIPVLFGVAPGNITPNFGDSRDGGARTHEGEDIMAISGTPVVSPTEAVVLRVGVGSSEGNYVYTANPGGETFVYMHLDRIGEGVSAGDALKVGDLIGYVGNTGNASGGAAHLHLEIHDDSREPLDPYPRLTDEFSLKEKMGYIEEILDNADDEDELAEFLAANFRTTFTEALAADIEAPMAVVEAIASLPPAAVPAGAGGALVRDLYFGISGEDVRTLQKMLNKNGYTVAAAGAGSSGHETTYFGPATRAAVVAFQIAKNIEPPAGRAGPLTRAALLRL